MKITQKNQNEACRLVLTEMCRRADLPYADLFGRRGSVTAWFDRRFLDAFGQKLQEQEAMPLAELKKRAQDQLRQAKALAAEDFTRANREHARCFALYTALCCLKLPLSSCGKDLAVKERLYPAYNSVLSAVSTELIRVAEELDRCAKTRTETEALTVSGYFRRHRHEMAQGIARTKKVVQEKSATHRQVREAARWLKQHQNKIESVPATAKKPVGRKALKIPAYAVLDADMHQVSGLSKACRVLLAGSGRNPK